MERPPEPGPSWQVLGTRAHRPTCRVRQSLQGKEAEQTACHLQGSKEADARTGAWAQKCWSDTYSVVRGSTSNHGRRSSRRKSSPSTKGGRTRRPWRGACLPGRGGRTFQTRGSRPGPSAPSPDVPQPQNLGIVIASSPLSKHDLGTWAGSSISTHRLELTSPRTQAVALDLCTSPGSASLRWNWSEALSLTLLFLSSEKDGVGVGQ